jgi:hypothetical protein
MRLLFLKVLTSLSQISKSVINIDIKVTVMLNQRDRCPWNSGEESPQAPGAPHWDWTRKAQCVGAFAVSLLNTCS